MGTVRVVVYIPEKIMELLKEAYPECKSNGEVILKYILESQSMWIEHRSFGNELTVLARSYLLSRYPSEYREYMKDLSWGVKSEQKDN